MTPLELIREKFSQDCSLDTVRHLVMSQFDLSEQEAQAEIDEYFKIFEMTQDER